MTLLLIVVAVLAVFGSVMILRFVRIARKDLKAQVERVTKGFDAWNEMVQTSQEKLSAAAKLRDENLERIIYILRDGITAASETGTRSFKDQQAAIASTLKQQDALIKGFGATIAAQQGRLDALSRDLPALVKGSDGALKSTSQTLASQLVQFQAEIARKFDEMRRETNTRFAQMSESAKAEQGRAAEILGMLRESQHVKPVEVARIQKEKLDHLAKQLDKLAENSGQQLSDLRGTVESQIAHLQVENSRRLDELRGAVEESFASRVGGALDSQKGRLDQQTQQLAELKAGLAVLARQLQDSGGRPQDQVSVELSRKLDEIQANVSERIAAVMSVRDDNAALSRALETLAARLGDLAEKQALQSEQLARQVEVRNALDSELKAGIRNLEVGRTSDAAMLNRLSESLRSEPADMSQAQKGRFDALSQELARLKEETGGRLNSLNTMVDGRMARLEAEVTQHLERALTGLNEEHVLSLEKSTRYLLEHIDARLEVYRKTVGGPAASRPAGGSQASPDAAPGTGSAAANPGAQ